MSYIPQKEGTHPLGWSRNEWEKYQNAHTSEELIDCFHNILNASSTGDHFVICASGQRELTRWLTRLVIAIKREVIEP